jgi:hypothetical protein
MDPNRKLWNRQQQALQRALSRPDEHQKAIELLLSQHAMVHSAKMARSKLWSFEDEVWQDTTEEIVRCIPRGCDHSIAWCIWHLARVEDVTMNLLVAGSPQLLHRDDWLKRLEPEELKQKVDPARLQRVMAEGAIVEAASGIADYWGKRTVAELLLMPPTRHNFVHLNEALCIKHKL